MTRDTTAETQPRLKNTPSVRLFRLQKQLSTLFGFPDFMSETRSISILKATTLSWKWFVLRTQTQTTDRSVMSSLNVQQKALKEKINQTNTKLSEGGLTRMEVETGRNSPRLAGQQRTHPQPVGRETSGKHRTGSWNGAEINPTRVQNIHHSVAAGMQCLLRKKPGAKTNNLTTGGCLSEQVFNR